jgi:putative endonuclease
VKREAAERRGRRGETLAALWLMLRGWRIEGRRIKTRLGEVDLIARRGKILAFVEVKTRMKASDLPYAVDEYRLRRVASAAKLLIPKYARGDEGIRIDVILLAPWTLPQIIEDAWQDTPQGVWR